MKHPHISEMQSTHLSKNKMYVFFPFTDLTLNDVLTPEDSISEVDCPIPEGVARHLLHQLLDAIAFCHRRGVMHRNLKPKHLLLKSKDNCCLNRDNLSAKMDQLQLLVADFALVRAMGVQQHNSTTEVVTLWYRAPEILMGLRAYSSAVDIWSVGCIFAEMIWGKPLFPGMSEVDQLFKIFSMIGTPTEQVPISLSFVCPL
jgi:serine/threonine protein kinase